MKITIGRVAWALSLSLILGGLAGFVVSPSIKSPAITKFAANPAEIATGGSATLTGDFANGAGVITPGDIQVASGASVHVAPSATTTYTLTVTDPAGREVTKTTTIPVNSIPAAPVTANVVPDPINTAREIAVPTGAFTKGASAVAHRSIVVNSGTPVHITPLTTVTYVRVAIKPARTAVNRTATIPVDSAPPAPVAANFAANRTATPVIRTYAFAANSGNLSSGIDFDALPVRVNRANDSGTSLARGNREGATAKPIARDISSSDSLSAWSRCTTTNTTNCAMAMNTSTTVATARAIPASSILFSPYKDVTISANSNTGEQQSAVTGSTQSVIDAMPNQTLTWAFATGTCGSENWGGVSPAAEATNVQLFVNAGKKYIVSTGGAAGFFDCPSSSAFLSFIQTYYSANMLGVDFDIEVGQSQVVVDNLINAAIAGEQQYPDMRFSFTIATLGGTSNPDLGPEGIMVVNEIKRRGLAGNYTINLLVMDYGNPNTGNCDLVNDLCDMGQSAITAAEALHSEFGIPYNHIELTPAIGQNHTQGEVFTLNDVDTMTSWMISNGLAGAHFLSLDRDNPCAAGTDASTCNGDPSAGILAYTSRFMTDLGAQ
jgi:chitinase